MNQVRFLIWTAGLATGASLLAGCGAGEPVPSATPANLNMAQLGEGAKVQPKADAGVTVAVPQGIGPGLKTLVASRSFTPRGDPFALLAVETKYEASQSAERLLQMAGGFTTEWGGPPPEKAPPTVEPQPYRRLSGVMLGDSVMAIIDMGDGKAPRIVRPGERVPDSEWTVVSIDSEKAVLRREGNHLPREVVVPLAGPISGISTGAPRSGGGGGGGAPGPTGGTGGSGGASLPPGKGGGGGGAGAG